MSISTSVEDEIVRLLEALRRNPHLENKARELAPRSATLKEALRRFDAVAALRK
jgi:hypothetical protein